MVPWGLSIGTCKLRKRACRWFSERRLKQLRNNHHARAEQASVLSVFAPAPLRASRPSHHLLASSTPERPDTPSVLLRMWSYTATELHCHGCTPGPWHSL